MDEEIKKLLEENLRLTREIEKMVRSIKNFVIWQRIWGTLKFLLIVVPLVLAIIYLPPFLKDALKEYQNLLDLTKNPPALENLEQINLQGLFKK